MAFTVGDAVRDIFTELGQFNEGIATGGSTVTVVDSGLGGSDDDWNGGTVMLTMDGGTVPLAAPAGQFAPVSDYTASGGTISIAAANAFTVAPAATDRYAVATSYYPLGQVLRGINRALTSLGDVPQVDTTTLDTAASTTEYACAVAWKRRPPYRIDIQTSTITSNYQWAATDDWEYIPAVAGTTGLIVFRVQPPASKDIRVWFKDIHSTVVKYSDVIYEGFNPELVIWKAMSHTLLWQNGRSQGTDESVVGMLNKSEQMLAELKALNPVWYPKRRAKLFIMNKGRDQDSIEAPAPAVRT
jgi:hypothetical protein